MATYKIEESVDSKTQDLRLLLREALRMLWKGTEILIWNELQSWMRLMIRLVHVVWNYPLIVAGGSSKRTSKRVTPSQCQTPTI